MSTSDTVLLPALYELFEFAVVIKIVSNFTWWMVIFTLEQIYTPGYAGVYVALVKIINSDQAILNVV